MIIRKKKHDENTQIDKEKVNDVLSLSKKILKILYILLIIIGIYTVFILARDTRIFHIIISVLKIVAPLFIGIVIAWLFDPLVKWLQKKGIKRIFGTILVYVAFVGILVLIVSLIIPILTEQINDFVATSIPAIIDTSKNFINDVFEKLSSVTSFDVEGMKIEIFNKIAQIGGSLTSDLPTITVNILKSIFSGIGTIVIGLVIGFYLLLSFDSATDTIITLLPERFRKDTTDLANDVNTSLRSFVTGALLDALLVFVVTSIGFYIVGLKAPLLFGLFCGLTNVIPFAGPYIGGIPAVIVGLSQGLPTGILTLIVIVVIQFIEGNFLQALIMSKTTKLHPVTIMLGLLVFAHFWGILGMLISTPIIAALKAIIVFFDNKYDILKLN
ncbi:MAG: AI-2E family transporter [Clostridium sp.]|nr:AI-2E family transporter [Clostridium sp.]MCM1444389.1 AI-2E family transporter [Candidatus Amulumruptor caecigallinarius]